ncbi:hypothetical protein DNTS_032309 [Danionella cerebrum]|uniref:Armadillo repeat-containing domain-containing protein n=1 Tax=Danionella cerebrum TaxID=2873325 RepID=A0A553PRA9_9TELE|nr:hypothetical protein DNTS_032309 [Danionella translucida]
MEHTEGRENLTAQELSAQETREQTEEDFHHSKDPDSRATSQLTETQSESSGLGSYKSSSSPDSESNPLSSCSSSEQIEPSVSKEDSSEELGNSQTLCPEVNNVDQVEFPNLFVVKEEAHADPLVNSHPRKKEEPLSKINDTLESSKEHSGTSPSPDAMNDEVHKVTDNTTKTCESIGEQEHTVIPTVSDPTITSSLEKVEVHEVILPFPSLTENIDSGKVKTDEADPVHPVSTETEKLLDNTSPPHVTNKPFPNSSVTFDHRQPEAHIVSPSHPYPTLSSDPKNQSDEHHVEVFQSDTNVTFDPGKPDPRALTTLYSTLPAHSAPFLHQGLQYHPCFLNRSYVPENCYTLPRHRERGISSIPEPGGNDLCLGVPMSGIHMQHMRAALDLNVDGALSHAYLQELFGSVVPHKRSSLLSLDGVRQDPRWRDPNLREVISMLRHPLDRVKANAAAYLQHLSFGNERLKQEVRALGGVPVLVGLLEHPRAEVHCKACGALRNLSYGQDCANKLAIRDADGIEALLRLLKRSRDADVRELVTGTLWNLSSHEPLKMAVIIQGLQTLTEEIIIPHSGLRSDPNHPNQPGEPEWTTVFKNTSGCLRNVSSDGAEARQKLRDCEGLSVENCVCILRNLSYHVHKEVPGAEKLQLQAANHTMRSGLQAPNHNARSGHCKRDKHDCFGGLSTKGKRHGASEKKSGTMDLTKRNPATRGLELLYQPGVVRLYLSLLKLSQNQNTLEAAAGAMQNLSAGHWAWSSFIRVTVRKEKALPVLVELLHSEADKVVRAVAIALRNLAIDHKNKELIGSLAMRDLLGNMPCGQQRPSRNLESETVLAILNTILESISGSLENARLLIQAQGVHTLLALSNSSQSQRETKAASHILQAVWSYKELRHTLLKAGWNKTHFKPPVSSQPKKQKSTKHGNEDITLPLMEKNQDSYSSVEQAERSTDVCHIIERETQQGLNDKRLFLRSSRPAVGLVERTPQPLDSWWDDSFSNFRETGLQHNSSLKSKERNMTLVIELISPAVIPVHFHTNKL